MENKSVKSPIHLRVPSPHRHWTASLCLVLLFSSLLFWGLLLGVVLLFEALSSPWMWLYGVFPILTTLAPMTTLVLCLESGLALWVAHDPQRPRGGTIAKIGLVVGVVEI